MKVVIRADASIYIGSGHIMRCLVLAEALRKEGDMVSFSSRPQQGDLIDFVRNKGFEVHELVTPPNWQTPQSSSDYAAWLQVPWQVDAESLIQQVNNVDLIIVDHYGLNAEWELSIKNNLSCKVFAIDDIVRKHQADLILDQTLLRDPKEYKEINPNSMVLAGCNFALLNPLFRKYREKVISHKTLGLVPKVLISMGGIDTPNATLQVLKELVNQKECSITVLLSPRSPHYTSVAEFCHLHSEQVSHFDFVNNMADLMSKQDIAIGAPGSTAWERACLGLPSIVIPLADNQATICRNLLKVGAVLQVSLDEISSKLQESYDKLVDGFTVFRKENLALCDGLGVNKVVGKINSIMNKQVILRSATLGDIDVVYGWQSSPSTRKYFNNSDIPEYEEHVKWMSDAINRNDLDFYIITNKEVKVGLVRLSISTNLHAEISILISPSEYGKGFAKSAMEIVLRKYNNYIIKAYVQEENLASQRLFETLNFTKLDRNHFEWRSS